MSQVRQWDAGSAVNGSTFSIQGRWLVCERLRLEGFWGFVWSFERIKAGRK